MRSWFFKGKSLMQSSISYQVWIQRFRDGAMYIHLDAWGIASGKMHQRFMAMLKLCSFGEKNNHWCYCTSYTCLCYDKPSFMYFSIFEYLKIISSVYLVIVVLFLTYLGISLVKGFISNQLRTINTSNDFS